MTAEAPKMSSFVDDFRTEQMNEANWIVTGGVKPTIIPSDVASGMRGLVVVPGSTIKTAPPVSGRGFDLNNSEAVFIVGRWCTGPAVGLYVGSLTHLYGFVYDDGTLQCRAIENGVTKIETLTDSLGATLTTFSTLRYLRIAHNSTTGRIEFYAGNNPDGSDQRVMTSTLGTVGTDLKPPANNIDDSAVYVVMNSGAGTNLYLRAVNAPAGGLPRGTPDKPDAYYVRDFSSWYNRRSNGFNSVANTMTHELKAVLVNSSSAIQVTQTSLTNKVLQITGDGPARTMIRTGYANTIKDVNYECTLTPLTLPTDGYIGLMWRISSDCVARYQLNITATDVSLNAYYQVNGSYTASNSPKTQLHSVPLTTTEGITYKWRVNHFGDKVVIYRDDEEIFSFVDLINYVTSPGHIGFDIGNNNAATTTDTIVAIDDISVLPAYDESTFSKGIAFADRGLGAYVKAGRRDETQSTVVADPSIVSSLETTLSGSSFRTIYHFTNYSNVVDGNTIAAAKYMAAQGRSNVIAWNSFGSDLYTSITSGALDSVIDNWGNAFDSIPGTVYVMPLPFPDLNVSWSPLAYTFTSWITGSTSTTITRSTATWTPDQFAGGVVRWEHTDGNMYYGKVTSNTSTTLTFTTVGSPPVPINDQKFWVRTNAAGGTAEEYKAAFQYISNRLRNNGCKASLIFAMNWASDTDTTSNNAYTGSFSSFYPGDTYVEAFLIRVVQQPLGTSDTAVSWRSLSRMLQGASYSGSLDYVPPTGETPYYQMAAQNSDKPIFVLAGVPETHHRYNNFEHGFGGSTVTAINSGCDFNDHFDSVVAGIGGSSRFLIPTNISYYNPSSFSGQRAVRFDIPTAGDSKYLQWDLPTTGVTRLGISTYFKVDDILNANEAGNLIEIRDISSPICKVRLDGATGNIVVTNSAGTTMGTLSAAVSEGLWYRLDLDINQTTSTLHAKITTILNSTIDRPDSWGAHISLSSYSINTPRFVRIGATIANTTNNIRNGVVIDSPKVSWDTTAETYSKARWLEDAFQTRGFPQVNKLLLFSGDQVNDITSVAPGTRWGFNNFDSRLDASTHTRDRMKEFFSEADPDRIHTKPQAIQAGYEVSSSVGNIEYMRLTEPGHSPLVISPKLGGILLRDFNLGNPNVRENVEDRPGQDGTNDYTKFVGSKAVSLNFVTFDDPSGSASFYTDVISTWAHPGRRPILEYKMKNGVERFMRLRPDSNSGTWTIDGVRAGFKETQLQLVGYDGKDFTSERKEVLVYQGQLTPVTTAGTASTPPIIRIYGGTSGCLNPTISLVSEESRTGNQTARVSLGDSAKPFVVPANTFIEIDMAAREVQLNGLSYAGQSMLRYLTDRQWFMLEPYYNMVLFETDDTNGWATVIYRDANL